MYQKPPWFCRNIQIGSVASLKVKNCSEDLFVLLGLRDRIEADTITL